jgi:ubiquinone/menaquinone biosynthesis C-methylase UbiE
VGVYHRCIFPYLLDRAMASRVLRRPRTRTLARARGRILEVGFGTGMNLAHYPSDVTRIEALDPDADLDRYSRPRIAAAAIDVDFHHLDAARLPFEDASFDTIVCTLTLCSIPEVARALVS